MPQRDVDVIGNRRRRSPHDRPSRRDLIIFDCDGVLVDSELLSCNALVACLRRHGIEIDLEAAMERFLGRGVEAVSDYCALSDRALPDDFFADLRLAVRAAFSGALQPIPGAAAVLRDLTVWGFIGGSHYASRDGRMLLTAAGADRVFDRMADFHLCEAGLDGPFG
jgi:beta-phosphoglucomutase-like phosphatase (HAD superfamily)